MNYQFSRRSFFQITTAVAFTQMLQGCSQSQAALEILFLANSIPIQLIGDFRKAISPENKVDFNPQTQLEQIFDSLLKINRDKQPKPTNNNPLQKIFNKSKAPPEIMSLGDFWLSSAIEQNLLQPLAINSLDNWQKLPERWQKLALRDRLGNVTANGQIYGAPYRWGSTVIAYRSDKLDESKLTITDWQDLWQPELRDRLSLLDSPREVVGLTLKKLGHSYNTENLDTVANLERELSALHQQVKFYSSDRYLEPLILGDTWAAVGWSTDILPLLKRYPKIEFAIPQSGTSLWADLWVKPQSSKASDENNNILYIGDRWIDFCWSDKSAKQISLFTDGLSPILLSMKSEELPQDLQDNVFLDRETVDWDRSEFLLPQTPATQKQYRELWQKIRNEG